VIDQPSASPRLLRRYNVNTSLILRSFGVTPGVDNTRVEWSGSYYS
jgi:hypothetical protein